MVKDLAELIHKMASIDLDVLFESPVFVSSLNLFTNTLEEIYSAELNEVLVRYLTYLID